MTASKPTTRIGNCSGFYGDRLTAMREMLEAGNLDYLTGDYLAELTMLILGKDTFRDPTLGYCRTFVKQAEESLGLALEKGIKIVANAGGLNPAGLSDKLNEVAKGLGVEVAIARVEGDDLRPRVGELGLTSPTWGNPLTANAYLGAFGIARALEQGADVVVTGRVTDASVVVGPAIHAFGWTPEHLDELAGAVVAGHIIECGTQATGGNFSGFLTLPNRHIPLGFPIAEMAADGSFVVTKNPGTGGAVTVDTTTAQLVYEIQTTKYLNPDVTVDLSTIQLAQVGEDRVEVTGVRGEPAPEKLKVCLNYLGGYRNGAEFIITGLDADAKIAWVKQQVEDAVAANRPARLEWSQHISPVLDAETEEASAVLLRVNAFDLDANKVGKALTGPIVELVLASYPGLAPTRPPGKESPYGVYTAGYVSRADVEHRVVHANGSIDVIPNPGVVGAASAELSAEDEPNPLAVSAGSVASGAARPAQTPTRESSADSPADAAPTTRAYLGSFVYARSGDKGGDANVGLWVRHDQDRYAERVAWLLSAIDEPTVRALIPEAKDLPIEVYPLPNLGGVNILIRGILQAGVAATSRFDPQAKGLGEWLRSRTIDIPTELLSPEASL